MTHDQLSEPEHVFDQTNGLIPSPEDDGPKSSNRAEVLRQRQESNALAYGMFGTGHQ